MQRSGTKVQRRPIHGLLLLDKPLGLSSNQALQKAKWLLRAEKAGHTGTLDPLATGVLPLCFGAATKFSQLHLDADKTYETTIRLGVKTSTGDAEGDPIQTRPVTCTLGQIVQALDHFTGPIEQSPPMHSALKKDGKPLYEYARAGLIIERRPRAITIHSLELLDANPSPADPQATPPSLRLRVRCSKGTYIRTLGEDIAEMLGCGGHLTQLRRIQTGPFDIAHCTTLETLEALDESQRIALLQPIATLLQSHTPIALNPEEAGKFLSGMRRKGPWPNTESAAVFAQDGTLLGSAHIQNGELIPSRLLNPLEIAQIG